MRVLWIAQNGGNYKKGIIKGTGGWIGALQGELVKRYPDMELGITFESSDYESIKEGNVTYFPVRTTDNNDFSKGVDRNAKKNIAEGYSERALAVASERQNTEKTCSDLINIYKTIMSESGKLSHRGGVIFLIHSYLYRERRAA